MLDTAHHAHKRQLLHELRCLICHYAPYRIIRWHLRRIARRMPG